jgi:hypothetical protein
LFFRAGSIETPGQLRFCFIAVLQASKDQFFVPPGTELTEPGVELQLAFGPEQGLDDPSFLAYELNGQRVSVRNGGMDETAGEEEDVVERRSRKRRARGSEEHGDDQGDGDGPPSGNGDGNPGSPGDGNPGSPGDGGGENGSGNESDGQSDGGNGTGGSGSDGDGGNGSGDDNDCSGDGNDGAGGDGDDEDDEEEEDESTTEEASSSSSDVSATGVVFQGPLVSNAPLRGRGPRVRGGHYGRDIVQ